MEERDQLQIVVDELREKLDQAFVSQQEVESQRDAALDDISQVQQAAHVHRHIAFFLSMKVSVMQVILFLCDPLYPCFFNAVLNLIQLLCLYQCKRQKDRKKQKCVNPNLAFLSALSL